MPRLRIHMGGAEWFSERPGGLNRYFENLFSAIRHLDEVDVTAAALGIPPKEGSSWGNMDDPPWRRISNMRRRFPILTPNDVFDSHFSLYGGPAVVGKLNGAMRVTHFQGPWAEESAYAGDGSLHLALKRFWERASYRNSECVILLSDAFRSTVVDHYGISHDRVHIIPPGVDLEAFKPIGSDSRNAKEAFEAICVRRLEKRMGIGVLLEAWAIVRAARPNIRLTICGEGSERSRLVGLVKELGLNDVVSIEGRVPDSELPSRYRMADCSIIPSVALEGFGLVALESLACGVPCVVTDCGGLPDAVRPFDSSLIVRTGDPKALADRLIAAVDHKLPSPSRCRNYAERFGWDRVAKEHVILYKEVLRKRSLVS
jgi:glycosyltransferase involved in cell wall biosynthesis